jgi:hypothetical protein
MGEKLGFEEGWAYGQTKSLNGCRFQVGNLRWPQEIRSCTRHRSAATCLEFFLNMVFGTASALLCRQNKLTESLREIFARPQLRHAGGAIMVRRLLL